MFIQLATGFHFCGGGQPTSTIARDDHPIPKQNTAKTLTHIATCKCTRTMGKVIALSVEMFTSVCEAQVWDSVFHFSALMDNFFKRDFEAYTDIRGCSKAFVG